MLLSLDEYIDFSQPVWEELKACNLHGLAYPEKTYSIYEAVIPSIYGIYYNRNMFYKNGVPELSDYKTKGIWNWESFVDIALKLTQDTDGDGIINQWGLVASDTARLSKGFLYANAETIIYHDGTKVVYNLGNTNSLKAMQFVSDLYNTYKVVPNKNGEMDFRNNNAAMCIREAYYWSNWKSFGLTDLRFEEMPFGPDNDGTYCVKNWGTVQYFFFPSNLKDPGPIVSAYTYWRLLWDEQSDNSMSFDEIVRFSGEAMVSGYGSAYMDNSMFTRDVNNFIEANTRKVKEERVNYFNPTSNLVTSAVFNKIATQLTTAASSIEALRPEVEAIISSVMGTN